MIRVIIDELEKAAWTAEVGLDINDPIADQYKIVQDGETLSLVMCSSLAYSGWLAKQVSRLVIPAPCISFHYRMMIDAATRVCAQVAETDAKITDAEGWTYDLSAQWEMASNAPGWMFQIDHEGWAWIDTGIVIEAFEPYVAQRVIIDYRLDYQQKRSAITGVQVGGDRYDVPEGLWWIPARQVGWEADQIVTQLQQCNNSQPGAYTLRFDQVGYGLEMDE